MVRILQRYVLREVIVPTALALLTLTFVLLIRMVFSEAENLAGAVTVGTLGRFMLYLLPTLLSQAVPMALLIGVLLGIGRLTADSEVKAMRAHGLNLFVVFSPILVLGALASVLILYNTLQLGPYLLTRSMGLLDRAKYDLINSLQPGRPYDEFNLPGAETDVVIYFEDKDEDGRMKSVYVSVQGGLSTLVNDDAQSAPPAADEDAATSPGLNPAVPGADRLTTGALPRFPRLPELETGEGGGAWTQPRLDPEDNRDRDDDDDDEKDDGGGETKTLILAASGRIQGEPENQSASLQLQDGTVHFLRGVTDPRYTVLDFKTGALQFDMDINSASQEDGKRKPELMTLAEIRREIARRRDKAQRIIARRKQEAPDYDIREKDVVHKRVWWLRAEICVRISIALACLAFTLIGVPLAILTKPSGKSIGITMAFLLIITYYGIMHYGVEVTRSGGALGPVVVFLPNVVLTILGILMFHRTVHR